ncbi:MAG: DNA polymerase III, subunit gamma and tau [Omnitrophica bacterium RIFCSPLOWO2_12_FULL_44_17]|uniref:DNA polymerase III subunit gamma/tau n=1 Tax=Candidatus Danuiimicrobium aquiferis TaxID=1801832 RepID=A0A1G1L1F7_9BACT|nr:MAG: DNA polymerase III, subunit gamma and tau [Omnitrophica bacterium RIFCSPHIGHO2_02_FULL_45_28]OGW98958.1 MAG: DNA polymerase III, subunit gamma and tau [Omnitrophica bacterium RIFCSPLOWO2_12_FULL_44_17]OGX04595.1 MAG: DNA polymerase III, subunit gamma and tau [Omnitrophica bacterium RIFCSPLOWO2_02_FULL_44_11]
MSYLIFARKFRPQTFDEIIGQEPVAETLKNAILKNRVAQSFLFTGSRGVGKTSTARILAKSLNCEKGPTPTPCNQCTACTEITGGSSLDVLEIDGASNRGIEEIRNLRENVKFKPVTGRYKVYIIDEVHMLTGEAFNALLKTLEEPPGHVKFIFATTEIHKVPLTILSRCQRFNFRRIPTVIIAQKLKDIAKKEKIKATDKALFLIAKAAEGSLRDGESLLDQMASCGANEIKEEDVIFSLGLTSDDIYFPLIEALRNQNSKEALTAIKVVLDSGGDLIQFSKGLLELFRDLLILNVGGKADELIEASDDRLAALNKTKSFFSRDEIFFSMALLQQLVRDIRGSQVPRFLVEACLLKIANRSSLQSIEKAFEELKTLNGKGSGVSQPASIRPAFTPSLPEKKKVNFSPERNNLSGSIKPVKAESAKEKVQAIPGGDSIEGVFGEAPKVLESYRTSAAVQNGAIASETLASSLTLEDVERVWSDLLEKVKAIKMSCGTYLAEAEPIDVADGLVVFGLPVEFKFHKEALETKDHKKIIQTALEGLLGNPVRISFAITEPDRASGESEPGEDKAQTIAFEKEIITRALNVFEGSKVIYRET